MLKRKDGKLVVVSDTPRRDEFPANRAERRGSIYKHKYARLVDKINDLRQEMKPLLAENKMKLPPMHKYKGKTLTGYYGQLVGLAGIL